ncbi:MAG: hypothetical protein LAN37_09280 [Acidobacteriia bacterium]|nr:hypothetical protein [Terriglobia bacterium]
MAEDIPRRRMTASVLLIKALDGGQYVSQMPSVDSVQKAPAPNTTAQQGGQAAPQASTPTQ